jgi:hypothetical protein
MACSHPPAYSREDPIAAFGKARNDKRMLVVF